MSQHSSLRIGGKGKSHRSVLSRLERIKYLVDHDNWTDEQTIFALPKIKVLKLKVKKDQPVAAAAEEEGATETGDQSTPEGASGKSAEGSSDKRAS